MNISNLAQAMGRGTGKYGSLVATVGATGTKIKTFNSHSQAIRLFNPDEVKTLSFSVDGGTTYLSIPPLGEVDRPYKANDLYVKGSASATPYEIEYVEDQ